MAFDPRWIVLHCSASANGTLESMRRYHIEEKGWDDVGYHFVIERDGATRHGRPLHRAGSHAKGANGVSLGICLTGTGDVPFEWAQFRALDTLVRALILVYGIPSTHVIGHREVNAHIPSSARTSKSCPGVAADLDGFRAHLRGAP